VIALQFYLVLVLEIIIMGFLLPPQIDLMWSGSRPQLGRLQLWGIEWMALAVPRSGCSCRLLRFAALPDTIVFGSPSL